MVMVEVAVDALRVYIRELRTGRGVTQEELAEVMGLSLRAFTSWESGRTEEIKSGPLFRAATFLKASASHLYWLGSSMNASVEEAIAMAKELLRDKTDNQISEFSTELQTEGKVAEAVALIHQLENDPAAIDRLLGYGQSLLDAQRDST